MSEFNQFLKKFVKFTAFIDSGCSFKSYVPDMFPFLKIEF